MKFIALLNSNPQQVHCLPEEAYVSPQGIVSGANGEFWNGRDLNDLEWVHTAVRVDGSKREVLWRRA